MEVSHPSLGPISFMKSYIDIKKLLVKMYFSPFVPLYQHGKIFLQGLYSPPCGMPSSVASNNLLPHGLPRAIDKTHRNPQRWKWTMGFDFSSLVPLTFLECSYSDASLSAFSVQEHNLTDKIWKTSLCMSQCSSAVTPRAEAVLSSCSAALERQSAGVTRRLIKHLNGYREYWGWLCSPILSIF